MLTTIRHTLQKSGKNVLLWLVLLAMAGVFSIPTLLKREVTMPWAVEVNGVIVPYTDYQRTVQMYQELIAQIRSQYGQMADMIMQSMGMPLNPQALAMEKFVSEALLDSTAHAVGIVVGGDMIGQKIGDPEYARHYLSDIVPPYVYEGGKTINPKALSYYLQKQGIAMNDFEEMIAKAIAREMVVNIINMVSYVPEFEVAWAYQTKYADKKLNIIALMTGQYIQKAAQEDVPDAVLEKYFEEENRTYDRYAVAEKRSGTLYTIKAQQYRGAVDEKAIEDYYEKNKIKEFVDTQAEIDARHIVVEKNPDAKVKLEETRNYLEEHRDDFARVASEQSIDMETKNRGGLLEAIVRRDKNNVRERAAFALQADGDMSPVIETESGYELVQRVHKRERTYKSLSSVRGAIIKKMDGDALKKGLARDVKTIQDNREKLTEIVALRKAQEKTVVDVVASDKQPYVKALFAGDVGSYGDGDTGVIVVLDEVTKKYTPPLESVKEMVKKDFFEAKAYENQEKDMIKIIEILEAQSLADAAKEFNLSIETTSWITPLEKTASRWDIPEQVIAQLDGKGAVVPYRHDDALLIMVVDDIRLETVEEGKKKELAEQLEKEVAGQTLQGFIASLYRNATIKVNQNLMITHEYTD